MGGLDPQPTPARQRETNWSAISSGLVLVLLVVVSIIILSRSQRSQGPSAVPAYAANLKFSELKMSAAENFVGSTVTYLDGRLQNTGNSNVLAVRVEVTFKNSLGEVVQKEILPVQVLRRGGPYPDIADLSAAPLRPNEAREIRLTFEHISSDWNRQYPELRVVAVTTS